MLSDGLICLPVFLFVCVCDNSKSDDCGLYSHSSLGKDKLKLAVVNLKNGSR